MLPKTHTRVSSHGSFSAKEVKLHKSLPRRSTKAQQLPILAGTGLAREARLCRLRIFHNRCGRQSNAPQRHALQDRPRLLAAVEVYKRLVAFNGT